MRTVWKFPIAIGDYAPVSAPEGARWLRAGLSPDGSGPCVWALVDPEAAPTDYLFRVAGTGHPINDCDLAYIGSFELPLMIFHVFYLGEV